MDSKRASYQCTYMSCAINSKSQFSLGRQKLTCLQSKKRFQIKEKITIKQ